MMDEHAREPSRQVWHFFLLVAVAFTVIGSHLLAARPLMVASFNNVAPAGRAPAAVAPDDWSLTIHRSDWNPGVARLLGHDRPGRPARLGWVVREWSFLTLPLVAWRQSDLAVFTEDGYGYRMAGLTEEQKPVAAAAAGWFPWWRFVWGWVPLAAFAAFVWAEGRWQARRRALLGLI